MKTRTFIISTILIISNMIVQGQEAPKNYIWKSQGKSKTTEIGLYGSLSGSYSQVLGKPAGYLGAKAGVVFNHKWTVGLAGYALYYDYRLTDLVQDGTYHLEAGYTGIFVEYMVPVGTKAKLGLSVLTGQGLAFYKYDKEYAEDRPWYQEKIDEETFSVFEPGVELLLKISEKWWLGANASYRNTSPVKLQGTSENLFNNFNTGVSARFGLF